MLTYWETLTAIQSNVPVNDSYAKLWGRKAQGGYTVTTYTGTLPATLTGTKAGYLQRYKVYGNLSSGRECGESTGNLFDISQVVTNTQVKNQGSSLKVMIPSTTTGVSAAVPNTLQDYCQTLSVGDEVTLSFETTGSAKYIYLSGANISWIRGQSKTITATMLSSVVIWYASGRDTEAVISNIMFNLGSTALPYEPYGYKLSLTAAGQDVDIHVGDTPLGTDEYVDYGEQKIYKRTENYYNYVGDTPALGYYVNPSDGSLTQAEGWAATDYISIDSDTIILSKVGGTAPGICLYDNDKQYLNGVAYNTSGAGSAKSVTISANGAKYARFSYNLSRVDTSKLTLVAGSTAPASYIPYLQPTDPPVPFPQIPTSAGSTIISWAGEGLAPSKVELKYERKR